MQGHADALGSLHSDSLTNDLLDALSAKLSSVSGQRDMLDKLRSVGQALRGTSKPTLEDVTDRCEAAPPRRETATARRGPFWARRGPPPRRDFWAESREPLVKWRLGSQMPARQAQNSKLESHKMGAHSSHGSRLSWLSAQNSARVLGREPSAALKWQTARREP